MNKKIGFLNFGHFAAPGSGHSPTAAESLKQQIAMAVAAEEVGMDGAWIRSHHFQYMMSAPFPTLAAMAAATSTIELGTGVIDLRYENPLYFAEEAATTDLIADGRLQLGISRGSPEAALDGQAQFGYTLAAGESWSDHAHAKGQRIRQAVAGEPIATADPDSSWTPRGVSRLNIQPHSPTLINRLWWGSGSISSGVQAGRDGYNLLSSTLLLQDDGRPFHIQQADQIDQYLAAYNSSGHTTGGMTAVTRSILPIQTQRDELMFGMSGSDEDQAGYLDNSPARSGPTYVGTINQLAEKLAADEAVVKADLVLVANPAQLGVEVNRHLFSGLVKVFEALGWK